MKNNPHISGSLYNCPCPVCEEHSIVELDQRSMVGFRLRAIHNAWVILKELEVANRKFEDGSYLAYVKERVKGKPRHLLKCVLSVLH